MSEYPLKPYRRRSHRGAPAPSARRMIAAGHRPLWPLRSSCSHHRGRARTSSTRTWKTASPPRTRWSGRRPRHGQARPGQDRVSGAARRPAATFSCSAASTRWARRPSRRLKRPWMWATGSAVQGAMMRTQRGQLSVAVDSFELLSKSPASSAREVPRPDGQGDPLSPALRGPGHEPRGAAPPSSSRFKIVSAIRRYMEDAGLLRGGDAVSARHPRRREREALRHALQRPRPRLLPAHRHRAAASSACSWAVSRRCSRSVASSATRAWTRTTTPSSPPWRPTRPSATSTA